MKKETMRILRDPKGMPPCVVVLGMFDGVHRGHQSLLMQGRALADAAGVPLCVCTFEPHPLKVLRPELAPPMLTTLTERAVLFAQYGVDILSVLTFTRERAAQPPEEFLAGLKTDYSSVAVVCGFNFSFGDKGRGNAQMLQAWGQTEGITVAVAGDYRVDDDTVSSTGVRARLQGGDVTGAARLLGHYYTVSGPVVHGRQIGRTLGYPTANVCPPDGKVLPGHGVYVCTLTTTFGEFPAMVDIGSHPTLPDGRVTVEAHIPGVRINLYNRRVRLTFLKKLRGEICFPDREALIAQLRRDEKETQAYFDALREREEAEPWVLL